MSERCSAGRLRATDLACGLLVHGVRQRSTTTASVGSRWWSANASGALGCAMPARMPDATVRRASRSPSPASTPASTSSVVTECSSSSPAPVIWPRQNADRLSVAFRWPSGARRTWSVSKTWAVRARAAVVCRMDRASRARDPRRRNQPLNEPIGELGQRASRRDPAVVASAHVPGRGAMMYPPSPRTSMPSPSCPAEFRTWAPGWENHRCSPPEPVRTFHPPRAP